MGINEKQVAVADNDAPTRDALSFTEGLHDNCSGPVFLTGIRFT
jgi:hypothetical protein